jgi:hypothetical protein
MFMALLPLLGCPDAVKDTGDTGGTDDTADSGDTDTGTWDGGGPLADPSGVQGKTYGFALGDGTIAEPANLGAIITAYMEAPVYLGVTSISETELDLLGGLGVIDADPAAQDTCVPTFDFASTSFDASSPSFTSGPVDATLYVLGTPVPVYELTVSGTFKSDGTQIGGMSFEGIVDTRPIGPLLNGGGGEDAVCEQAINFGEECIACPDGPVLCLQLSVVDILASEVAVSMAPVAEPCE